MSIPSIPRCPATPIVIHDAGDNAVVERKEGKKLSKILQMPCRFLILLLAKASYRAHVIVFLALLPGFLGCLFACVSLDVLYFGISERPTTQKPNILHHGARVQTYL